MSAITEVEFQDRYGDRRVIHKTRHGLKVKRIDTTPALALNQELSGLVGSKIRELREARGWTLAELCIRSGLRGTPKNRMWEIENAIRKEGVRLGTLYAIAMALGVEAGDLLPTIAEVADVIEMHPGTPEIRAK